MKLSPSTPQHFVNYPIAYINTKRSVSLGDPESSNTTCHQGLHHVWLWFVFGNWGRKYENDHWPLVGKILRSFNWPIKKVGTWKHHVGDEHKCMVGVCHDLALAQCSVLRTPGTGTESGQVVQMFHFGDRKLFSCLTVQSSTIELLRFFSLLTTKNHSWCQQIRTEMANAGLCVGSHWYFFGFFFHFQPRPCFVFT